MRRFVTGAVMALSFFVLVAESLVGQSPGDPQPPPGSRLIKGERQGDNQRLVFGPLDAAPRAPGSPSISFIDSPTASCYQPDAAQNVCYINWYQMYVDAGASNYMITMTLTINPNARAHFQGFFQQTFYVPYGMQPNGFKVACGLPGAGGNPSLGNAYAYTIRARASDGLGSANYGTAYCPPYQP